MKNIAVKLPEDLLARLDAVARRRPRGRSGVVRSALERFLAEEEGTRPGSFAERARALAGSVSGPRDLSTAKKHLKGYGR